MAALNGAAAAGHAHDVLGGVWCQVYDANMMDDMVRFETVGCSRVVPYIEMGMTFDEYPSPVQVGLKLEAVQQATAAG